MNVLILGATGMLGSASFRVLSENSVARVFGTIRRVEARRYFAPELASRLVVADDLEDHSQVERLFDVTRPHVVLNCTALRRKATTSDLMKVISMFSLLPHRLSRLCRLRKARFIQISSDGVFSGARGDYTEDDNPDAGDAYGIAKLLGEVSEPHAITLRTSIIGHELQGGDGLVAWFFSQQGQCRGYRKAVFSGLPTVVLARVIRDVVIPRPDLSGIYHVAARPISKYDLLRLVAEVYGKVIEIVPDDSVVIDRSLNADRFRNATGYVPPDWRQLIEVMHSYQ